jgi:hypothetical protein
MGNALEEIDRLAGARTPGELRGTLHAAGAHAFGQCAGEQDPAEWLSTKYYFSKLPVCQNRIKDCCVVH